MHHHHEGWDVSGLIAALPPELALYAAVFLMGLAGGATHCLGMCGPFVLSRALRIAAASAVGGAWSRLRAALLPGYHLGRAITYAGFGALAGGAAEGFARITELGWPRWVFVAVAALLLILGALGGSTRLHLPGTQMLAARIGRVAPAPGFVGDLVTGVALGFLPCGLVLAALTASVSAGGALEGALGMASFALGTALPLSLLSGAGAVAARRWRETLRRLSLPLLALNLAALGVWLVH
jgi:sulfite exporter TauE/SafE